ncbi:DUF6036 family nucleotidyltransferase [Paractinoplanes brasiliensis]|uniref:DUF6036 domain-containing protein n=1 Tax=Paractinoplanes brasiliensis TaxID=52695 RepID=A0A4R6K0W6_9ACTN|nr:DUF6036 family nucleotidyltransferase [Actinoplanes brasiliensis]TDO41701.1 hypothetical protein C8E87_5440 [Actinoplanes brasiliensis]GID27009.1 hypothetical protein Abr02nite_19920 [Actinoplanes brasiliensis]
MRREQLEHVLRAASQIADDPDVVVIGSQSILAAIPEDLLPLEATASMEVDVAFFDDSDNQKSDRVDGAIGELSPFHEMYGYYAQGVSVSTATLPPGWRDRLVLVESQSTRPGRGYALDPHDCVVSKLVAGREKDHAFSNALIETGLIDPTTIAARIDTLDVDPRVMERLKRWIRTYTSSEQRASERHTPGSS